MNEDIIKSIAAELKVREQQVQNTLALLEEGNTFRLLPVTARNRHRDSMKNRSSSSRRNTTTS